MGIQDFNPTVQQAVNRFNSLEDVSALSRRAKAEGFQSLSMDLIYGLPHQTEATIANTLEQVIELNPERLSLFNYAHMPHLFKSQRQIDASALPEPQAKLNMLHYAIDRLQQAGYIYIGMDHFAKPDDPLAVAQQEGLLQRNFQGYATHGNCDLLAFGVSAISAIDSIFVQNHKDITTYSNALQTGKAPTNKGLTLTEDDQLRQAVINQLICHFELDFLPYEHAYGIHFPTYFSAALAELHPMAADQLVQISESGIKVLSDGRLLIRRICMAFDIYLPSRSPQNSQVSRASNTRYSRIL